MTTVTVRGAHGETISLTYDNSRGLFGQTNASLAQAIADAITAGVTGGSIYPADNAFGPPPLLPPGETGEYVQSKPGVSLLPPHYDDVVVSAPSALILGDGGANEKVLVGSGDLTFFATGGSGTVIGGGGDNLIDVPSFDGGSWTVSLGNGNNTVLAVGGGNDTISTGTGFNDIQLGSGNSVVITAGTDTITATGNATITSSGTDLVYGGRTLYFVGGSGGSTVFGGSGSDTLLGGSGRDLLVGGSGGHNVITAGTGPATLIGGGSGDQLYANGSQAQLLQAGAGAETLYGTYGNGADTFQGGSGKDLIFGNGVNSTFIASSGNATISAAPSANNVFEFIKGHAGGTELVQNLFSASQVNLDLSGYGGPSYKPTQQLTSGGLMITLSDGSRITFENINSGSITKITST